MKKTLLRAVAGSSLCAFALVGTASVASAGEITGNGRLKGVNPNASICAFSGQNDEFHDEEYPQFYKNPAHRVQTFGHVMRAGFAEPGTPGMACNKNAEPPQEP